MKPLDSRQALYRGILQQLFPYVAAQTLDILLSSIDQDLTPPLNVTADNPANLTINVEASLVANSESNRQKSINFIGGTALPVFNGGTVTFPSSSGGNITTSTGGSTLLTLSSGFYCKVLVSLDQLGNLETAVGTQAATPIAAFPPTPTTNTLPFCYVLVYNNSGTIENIAQNDIFQIIGGGSLGSGGAVQDGLITINQLPQNITVSTGDTLTYPDLIIGSGIAVVISTGANFVGVSSVTITGTGTMTLQGTAMGRIL